MSIKKIHVNELSGNFLNYAVAVCEYGDDWDHDSRVVNITEPNDYGDIFQPAYNWKQGGPIIQQNKINLVYYSENDIPEDESERWDAFIGSSDYCGGATPLIAAMRAYVATQGNYLELSEEEYGDLL